MQMQREKNVLLAADKGMAAAEEVPVSTPRYPSHRGVGDSVARTNVTHGLHSAHEGGCMAAARGVVVWATGARKSRFSQGFCRLSSVTEVSASEMTATACWRRGSICSVCSSMCSQIWSALCSVTRLHPPYRLPLLSNSYSQIRKRNI